METGLHTLHVMCLSQLVDMLWLHQASIPFINFKYFSFSVDPRSFSKKSRFSKHIVIPVLAENKIACTLHCCFTTDKMKNKKTACRIALFGWASGNILVIYLSFCFVLFCLFFSKWLSKVTSLLLFHPHFLIPPPYI